MHHAGQGSAVLRLDPPGLGNLSVHVALGQGGQVNVLFVPAVAQTAQLLNLGMEGLRHAMAASGLTLGQANVSGGGAQSPGQNTSQNSANNPRPSSAAAEPPAAPTTAAVTAATANGLSAYA
jgi:flagellar hook-length control protein FliK